MDATLAAGLRDREIVVTGASGFVGRNLTGRAAAAGAIVHAIGSPRRGGPDLSADDAVAQLHRVVSLRDPSAAAVIHGAARVDQTLQGACANLAMASHVAEWARETGVGSAVLVSSVSVAPAAEVAFAPEDRYGVGKAAAELTWYTVLPAGSAAAVRLAGVWGWQEQPTLFWNRLLRIAAGLERPKAIRVDNPASIRNYLSADEAADCLLTCVARRAAGTHVAAGMEEVRMKEFVEQLEPRSGGEMPSVEFGDAVEDRRIYEPSPAFDECLKPFDESLDTVWRNRPIAPSGAKPPGARA